MEKDPKDAKRKLLEGARKTYREFDDFAAIREGDSVLMKIGKVLLRVGAISLMILLSPFVLIGLIMAFLAAL